MPTSPQPVIRQCQDLNSGLSISKVMSLERPQCSCQEVKRGLSSVCPFLVSAIRHGGGFWMGRDLGQHFVQPPLSGQICQLGEKLSQQGSVRNWPGGAGLPGLFLNAFGYIEQFRSKREWLFFLEPLFGWAGGGGGGFIF